MAASSYNVNIFKNPILQSQIPWALISSIVDVGFTMLTRDPRMTLIYFRMLKIWLSITVEHRVIVLTVYIVLYFCLLFLNLSWWFDHLCPCHIFGDMIWYVSRNCDMVWPVVCGCNSVLSVVCDCGIFWSYSLILAALLTAFLFLVMNILFLVCQRMFLSLFLGGKVWNVVNNWNMIWPVVCGCNSVWSVVCDCRVSGHLGSLWLLCLLYVCVLFLDVSFRFANACYCLSSFWWHGYVSGLWIWYGLVCGYDCDTF